MSWNQQKPIIPWNINQQNVMNFHPPVISTEQQKHMQQWTNWQKQFQEWHYKYSAQYLEQLRYQNTPQPPLPKNQENTQQSVTFTQKSHQLKKPPQYYFPPKQQSQLQQQQQQQQFPLQSFQSVQNLQPLLLSNNKQAMNYEPMKLSNPLLFAQEKHEETFSKNQVEFQEESQVQPQINQKLNKKPQIMNIKLKSNRFDVEKLTLTELNSKQQKLNKLENDFTKNDSEQIERKNDLLNEKKEIEGFLNDFEKCTSEAENVNISVEEQSTEKFTLESTTQIQSEPKENFFENNVINGQSLFQTNKINFINENNNDFIPIPGLDLNPDDELLENEKKNTPKVIDVDLIIDEPEKQKPPVQQYLHKLQTNEQIKFQQSWAQEQSQNQWYMKKHSSECNSNSLKQNSSYLSSNSQKETVPNQQIHYQLGIQQQYTQLPMSLSPLPLNISSLQFQNSPLPQQLQINVPLQSSITSILQKSATVPITPAASSVTNSDEEFAYRRQDLHQKQKPTKSCDKKKDVYVAISVVDYNHKYSFFQQHFYNSMKKYNYNHKKKSLMQEIFSKSIYDNKVEDLCSKNIYEIAIQEYRQQIPSSNSKIKESIYEEKNQINQLSLTEQLEQPEWIKREYVSESSDQDLNRNQIQNRERVRKREQEKEHEFEKEKEERFHGKGSKQSKRMLEEIIEAPGRAFRPSKIVIILRGPPGSGKSYLAQIIKDTEVYYKNSAPRILALDDYFDLDKNNDVQKMDKSLIRKYELSLKKAFEKTIREGFFPLIIVDCIHDKIRKFSDMVEYARSNNFQVYICQLSLDLELCLSQNIHKRSKHEIENIIGKWERTPTYYIALDPINFFNRKNNNVKYSVFSDKLYIRSNEETLFRQSSSKNSQECSSKQKTRQELLQPSLSRVNYGNLKQKSLNDYYENVYY